MSNDNKESKNNAPCEEKQEARELTPDELAKVTGGAFSITRRGTVATGRIETGEAPSILT